MGYKALSTVRSGATSAVSRQATIVNTNQGFAITGSSITPSTTISTEVVTPGQGTTVTPSSGGIEITSINYLNSNGSISTANAVSTTSGGNIKINGTGFSDSMTVVVGGATVSNANVTVANTSAIIANLSTSSPGNVSLYVFNSSGSGAQLVDAVRYSGVPTWTTSSVSFQNGSAANVTLVASSDSTLTYTLQDGSSLPTGISLISTGYLSGTATGYTTNTTGTFVIVATDLENQATQQTINWTVAIADPQFNYTALLLNGETSATPFINDASTNSFALTIAGDTKPNNFNPYTPGYYSNYFDGNGDYLTVPSSASFGFGTGDFTIECWLYPTNAGAALNQFYDNRTTTDSKINIGVRTNTITYCSGSSVLLTSAASSITNNAWHHVAVVRYSGTTKIYINGTQSGSSYTDSNNYASPAECVIGTPSDSRGSATYSFAGNISNMRVVKGTAVYTTTFTPSTTPLTAVTNTSLLTCQSNRLIDNSVNNFAITKNGDTTVSPAQPFSTPTTATYDTQYSTYFDGTGDYLTTPNTTAFNLGTGDFTIEAWYRPKTLTPGGGGTSDGSVIISAYPSTSTITGYSLSVISTGHIKFHSWVSGTQQTLTATNNPLAVNGWYHLAVVRISGTYSIYVNGVAATFTGTMNQATNTGGTIKIGALVYDTYYNYATGHISNVRVVKGTALYTSAFTPSTTPLTITSQGATASQVSLLTCQNSTLIDNSTNAFTITSAGQAQPVAVSPFTMTTSNTTVSSLGSAYFDGTGDYLTTTPSIPAFGTGDFTVEAWVNFSDVSASRYIIDFRLDSASGSNESVALAYQSTSGKIIYISGTTINITGTTTITSNQWYHVSLVRKSGTTTMFVGGLNNGSVSDSSSYTNFANRPIIGAFASGANTFMLGYIADLRVIKGTALYTANFLPPQTTLTPVTNTQLLTCQYNGGANNNGFVDNSTFNNVVTRAGNTTQGTFSPYSPTGWSNYFSGTTDRYSIATGTVTIGTSTDYTIEAWVYVTGTTGSIQCISTGQNNGVGFIITNSLQLQWNKVNIGGGYTSTGTLSLNQWTHVALCRASGTARFWINGVLAGSNTDATAFSSTSTQISGSAAAFYFKGYISNFRQVVGTALYTSAFIPSVTPLTAVPGTVALTCQSNRFIDNSGSNSAITPTGSPSVQAFSPFAPAAAAYGGSGYFDGTGDYLTVPYNSNFDWQTSPTTIEAWLYPTVFSGYKTIMAKALTTSGANDWELMLNSTGNVLFRYWTGTSQVLTSTNPLVLNTWSHIAFVYDGSTIKLYINGVVNGSAASVSTASATSAIPLQIGASYGGIEGAALVYFTGYMSNVRFTKGTALYTTNFTLPTAPLTPVPGTNLLLNYTSGGIIDAHSTNVLETVGNAQVSTAIKKFGTASIAFDGTGDWVTASNNPNLQLRAGDFTIEGWVYLTTLGSARGLVSNGTATTGWTIGVNASNLLAAGYTSTTLAGTTALVENTWYHFAMVRSGSSTGNIKIYLNGVLEATSATAITTDFSGTDILYIGADRVAGSPMIGNMDDVRITKGFARYTANFTPPASAFLGQ